MLNILYLISIIFGIEIINGEIKIQSINDEDILNKPQFYYQQRKQNLLTEDQKWFYSSNQQRSAYSWYETKNDLSSKNFYKNTLPTHNANRLSHWKCGRSQVTNRFARIMGGQNAVPHSYPWMVSLAKRSYNNLHLCGGVLLTRRHVLTAAHCMEDFNDISDVSILAGIHSTNERNNPISTLFVDIHPQYDPNTFANDIAIITLASLLPENDPRIGMICLPPDDVIGRNYPPLQSSSVAIGWGSTSYGGRPLTSLQQVVLPILDINKWPCDIYATNPEGQICAGQLSGGVDTCQADSGGPLMIENADSRWEIIGITSFGKSCGKPNSPGIYTRVGNYNNFIRSIIHHSKSQHYYYSSSLRLCSNSILISIILIISFQV